MIGPMWCVESNAWLRFNFAADGSATAEMASIDQQNQYLTTAWSPIDPATWHVVTDPKQHSYYSLANGFLFRYEGINKISGEAVVAKFHPTEERWQPERKTNPFQDHAFSTIHPADDFLFPLTPEQQEEKWHALQQMDLLTKVENEVDTPFDDPVREELLSFAPVAIVGFEAKNFPTYGAYLAALRDVILNEENNYHTNITAQAAKTVDYEKLQNSDIDRDALFVLKKRYFLELLEAVYNHIRQQFHLPKERLGIDIPLPEPARHDAGADFFPDEWEGIEDLPPPPPPPHAPDEDADAVEEHFEIQPLVDGPGLRTSGIIELVNSRLEIVHREELLARLLGQLGGIFNNDYDSISSYYDALLATIHDANNPFHQEILAIAFDENTLLDQQLNPTNDEEIAAQLRKNKRDFLFNTLRIELRNIGKHITNNTGESILFGLHGERPQDPPFPDSPRSPDLTTPTTEFPEMLEETSMAEIKAAVATAQKKYAEWYSGQREHRGSNGFFSWLRHGAYGQSLAKKFNTKISNLDEESLIINNINHLLTDKSTRYHRHSFASFLLDELTNIQHPAWSKLNCATSTNHYDQGKVIDLLSKSTLIQQRYSV